MPSRNGGTKSCTAHASTKHEIERARGKAKFVGNTAKATLSAGSCINKALFGRAASSGQSDLVSVAHELTDHMYIRDQHLMAVQLHLHSFQTNRWTCQKTQSSCQKMKIAPSAVMILLTKDRERASTTLKTSHRTKIRGRSSSTLRTSHHLSRSHLAIHHAGGKGDKTFKLIETPKIVAHLSLHLAKKIEPRSALHNSQVTK